MESHDLIWWPLGALAFQASGRTSVSYPIEVGLCAWHAPDEPLRRWSALVSPAHRWREYGEGDVDAKVVHGLRPADLDVGLGPTDTVWLLNAHASGIEVLWCDGGAWDVHLLRVLTRASAVRPAFGIGHVGLLTVGWPDGSTGPMRASLDAHPPTHRAGPDAERLVRALAVGAAVAVPGVVDLLDGKGRHG